MTLGLIPEWELTDEVGLKILSLMREEGASQRRACKVVGCSTHLFDKWKNSTDERHEQYTRARQSQREFWADELTDISDGANRDDPTKVARARLRIDTRKWLLSKLDKRTYGDTTQLEHTGNIKVVVQSFSRLPAPTVIEGEVMPGDGEE